VINSWIWKGSAENHGGVLKNFKSENIMGKMDRIGGRMKHSGLIDGFAAWEGAEAWVWAGLEGLRLEVGLQLEFVMNYWKDEGLKRFDEGLDRFEAVWSRRGGVILVKSINLRHNLNETYRDSGHRSRAVASKGLGG
jgi:hypothetical protein